MADLPQLLMHPQPYRDEGPQGYLLRLATENYLSLSDLANAGVKYDYVTLVQMGYLPNENLDLELHAYVRKISHLRSHRSRVWNDRYARFCPLCLSEVPFWRVGWEMVFHDACPEHGVMLVDQCSSCRKQLKWIRESMIRCSCGADLRMEVATKCNDSSSALSKILVSKLHGLNVDNYPAPVEQTDVEETQQLIRYLGAGLRPGAGTKPLKIRDAGALNVSWTVTSYAAETIANWPAAFHKTLTQLQQDANKSEGRSFRNVFGWSYHYLYRVMKSDVFEPVRQAFNKWVVMEWQGGVAKRNRRLLSEDFQLIDWIPGKEACNALGISRQRLKSLIRDGRLEAQEYVSELGRVTITVRRDQITLAREMLAGCMTIEEAGQAIGLCRKRMRAILRILFPNATRQSMSPWAVWHVPRTDVEDVLRLTDDLPVLNIADEDCVTVDFILRYWSWEIVYIVGLIEAAKRKEITAVACIEGFRGISGLVFRESELRAWREKSLKGLGIWLTIPQVCKVLKIKQQVAYQIVVKGFLEGEKLPTLRRGGVRVHRMKLEEFKKNYIFATEINAKLGTVSIRLQRLLAERNVFPVSGPSVDECRQVLYARSDEIQKFIDEYAGQGQDEFRLV